MLNQKFKSASSAIASYDWIDIANGAGYSNFYLSGNSSAHAIVTNAVYSNTGIEYYRSTSTATLTADASSFNTPRTIKGVAFLSYVSHGDWGGGGSGSVTCELFKVSGGVETSLGTAVTLANTKATTIRGLLALSLTQTSFSIGDILRLKVTLTIVDGWVIIGTNTLGNIGSTYAAVISTTDYPLVPFKIEVPFIMEI